MFQDTEGSQKSKQVYYFFYSLEFFIACILLGLEYIHSQNIIHRDIKPENLVLDEKGFVRITDFGIAKFFSKKNSSETSGTPGYMAPEVMNRQNHTAAVDYFAVGVIGYEFMLGRVYFLLTFIETLCWEESKGNKRANDGKASLYKIR